MRGLLKARIPEASGYWPVIDAVLDRMRELDGFAERILAARRQQWLTIWGLVFTFFGVGLGTLLANVAGDDNVWAVGAIPGSIGLALLLGATVVKAPAKTPH